MLWFTKKGNNIVIGTCDTQTLTRVFSSEYVSIVTGCMAMIHVNIFFSELFRCKIFVMFEVE